MNQSAIKLASEGAFENQMAYGWASNATAWEQIFTLAKKSEISAKAVLTMISSMEEGGVADLPRAGQFMRTAARIAHHTLREAEIARAISSCRGKR